MNTLAGVLGGNAITRAKAWDAYFTSNLQTVTAKTASIPVAQRPTVYYSTSGGPLSTEADTPWITEGGGQDLSTEQGVKNPNSFAFPTISAETLLKWNPQVIVCESASAAKQFEIQPQYATLSAVRNHKVYAAPFGIWPWVTGTAEQPLAPLWLAKTLYPTMFPNVNLVSVVKSFYSKFYFYKLSDQQAMAIINATLVQN